MIVLVIVFSVQVISLSLSPYTHSTKVGKSADDAEELTMLAYIHYTYRQVEKEQTIEELS